MDKIVFVFFRKKFKTSFVKFAPLRMGGRGDGVSLWNIIAFQWRRLIQTNMVKFILYVYTNKKQVSLIENYNVILYDKLRGLIMRYLRTMSFFVKSPTIIMHLPMLDSVVVRLDNCSTNFGIFSHFSSQRERSISFSRLVLDLRAISSRSIPKVSN